MSTFAVHSTFGGKISDREVHRASLYVPLEKIHEVMKAMNELISTQKYQFVEASIEIRATSDHLLSTKKGKDVPFHLNGGVLTVALQGFSNPAVSAAEEFTAIIGKRFDLHDMAEVISNQIGGRDKAYTDIAVLLKQKKDEAVGKDRARAQLYRLLKEKRESTQTQKRGGAGGTAYEV